MADKIDQLTIGSTSYDIDLPPDATPSIASLTATGLITSSNGTLPKAGGAGLRNMIDSSTSIYEGRLEVDKGASNITNVQSTYYQVDKIIRKTNASTTFTLNLPSLSNGASQTLATETYVTSRGYVTQNDLDSYIDATFIIDALGYTPQSQLTTQTAYTNKGSATKVPQITTNTLGQVTGITEITITHKTLYKHDIVITDSSSTEPRKLTFTLYAADLASATPATFSISQAINLLYHGAAAWAISSTPITIVLDEWSDGGRSYPTSAYFYPRHCLSAVTKNSSGVITAFTIIPTEGSIAYNKSSGYIGVGSDSPTQSFTVNSSLTITDYVTEMSALIL